MRTTDDTTEDKPVAHLPDYVSDLRALNEEQRNSLPISIDSTGSVISIYRDNVWEFYPYIYTMNTPENRKQINFAALEFADGSRLTDPQHAGLLASVKDFLYCRLANPHPRSHKTLKPQSLKKLGIGALYPLLRWMVAEGYARFTNLTPLACRAYVEHSKQRAGNENSRGGPKGKRLSSSTLQGCFSLLENLYVFRDHLEDPLPEHPWPESSSHFLAEISQSKAHPQSSRGETELIPSRLTKKLAQGALRYIDTDYGVKLLDCRDARDAGEPLKDHLADLKMKNWRAVKKEIARLLTACYVVGDLFSGLRDSEMASLEIGCYREHEGWDGAIYGWINGTSYKTEKDPKPAEWMVPPVVRKALDLAERAVAPLHAKAEKQIAVLDARLDNNTYATSKVRQGDLKELHNLERCRRAFFLTENKSINVMSSNAINARLKDFAAHVDLRVEASDMEFVQDRDRIKVGDIWPLSPHHFRKTFAVTVAGNTLGDLRYLREHFNHWSMDMTLYYANSGRNLIDQSLFDEILTERDELQACIFEGWLDTSKHVTGAGARKILEYRERKEVQAYKDHKELARKLGKGFYIRGTGHSWCTSENCKGMGVFDITACEDCENRFIDETHLHVWRGIRQQQIELLAMDDIGDPMWERAIKDLRYAEKILTDLGDEFKPHPIPPMPSERRKIV